MRNGPFAQCLLYLIFFSLSISSGCQTFHVYRPVGVLVRDAETKKPIPAAEVYLTYPLTRDSVAPYNSSGITREDGIARLRAAPSGKYGIQLQAVAQGYLSEDMNVSAAAVEKISPPQLFEAADRRPASFVIEMYSEPRFTVELVVPSGYRGLVKAEVQIQEDVPCAVGQRSFRYEVSPSGTVQVKGPALLRRVNVPEYRASYADGTLLDGEMSAGKVGFRWLKTEGKEQYFVVGTQAEYDAFRYRLLPEEAKVERSSSDGGGKSGGRGGRHRRGSQPS